MQSEKTVVSVIVPVYRVEAYLRRCVDSLLAQTYGNMEIILVNDGSPDGSPAMCDAYAARYSHVRVIHKENGGLSSARLSGFREARGEYILFIDSDDYVLPAMVEALAVAMNRHGADMALCSYSTRMGEEMTEYQLPYDAPCIEEQEITARYVLPLFGRSSSGVNIPGFLCLRMMKRSLIQERYFVSENIYYKEDHVFDLEYAKNISRIAIVNEPLYVYCINKTSLSNRYRPGKWKMYENIYHYFQQYAAQNNIVEPEDRMVNMIAGGIFASIDNAVLSGNYATFRRETADITAFAPAKAILSAPWRYQLSLGCFISLMLFRCKLRRVLYFLRKRMLY